MTLEGQVSQFFCEVLQGVRSRAGKTSVSSSNCVRLLRGDRSRILLLVCEKNKLFTPVAYSRPVRSLTTANGKYGGKITGPTVTQLSPPAPKR